MRKTGQQEMNRSQRRTAVVRRFSYKRPRQFLASEGASFSPLQERVRTLPLAPPTDRPETQSLAFRSCRESAEPEGDLNSIDYLLKYARLIPVGICL